MATFTLAGAFSSEPTRVLTPALTIWSRLEPVPFTPDMQAWLQAEVADPLWFLARQWQYGEFQGEDAGTPVMARVEGEQGMLSRAAAGPIRSGIASTAVDYDHTRVPPEVQVERESSRPTHLRFAIDAACLLMRMLQAGGAGAVAESLRTMFPLVVPAVD